MKRTQWSYFLISHHEAVLVRYFLLFLIITGSFTLAPAAKVDKIVRWVDEQGVAHFGNRAPIDSNADVEEIDVVPTNSLAVPTNTVSQDLRLSLIHI